VDLSTIKTGLKGWFANATGLTAIMKDEAKALLDVPHGVIDIGQSIPFGPDNIEYLYDGTADPGEELTTKVKGLRKLNVLFSVRSRDQSGNNDARYYLERARAGRFKPSAVAYLTTAGLDFINSEGAVRTIPEIFQGRVESRDILEIMFSVAENITFSEVADSDTYIEKIELSSDYVDITDTALELDDYQIPQD